MNKPIFYLYGRENCHLCHDMWADVRVYCAQNQKDIDLVWVDIDEECSEYATQYAMRIPVLTTAADHIVVCEGRLNTSSLAQAFKKS